MKINHSLYLRPMRFVHRHQDKIVATTLLLLVAVIFLYTFNSRHNHTANLDSVSYLSIAEKYSAGLFVEAIDTYWSPFVSWAVAVFIKFGVSGLTGFALLNAFASMATIIIGLILIRRTTKNSLPAQLLFMVLATPFLLNTSRDFLPDSLVVTWSLGLVLALLKADKIIASKAHIKNYIVAGVVLGSYGALGYFIKLYLLFFFIGAITLWTMYRLVVRYKDQRVGKLGLQHVLMPAIATAIFLTIFSAPWIGAMSWKYKQPILGTSLKQNVGNKFIDNTNSSNSSTSQISQLSLSPPPDEYSVTHSEGRPGDFGSRENSKLNTQTTTSFIKNRIISLPEFYRVVTAAWVAAVPVIILSAVVLIQKRLSNSAQSTVAYLTGAFSVYMGGYLIATISPNVRYLWPLGILAITAAVIILFGIYKKNRALSKVVIAIASAALISTIFYHNWPHPGTSLQYGGKKAEYKIAEYLESSTGEDFKDSRIAGNNRRPQYYIAYAWQAQSYGSVKGTDEFETEEIEALLDKHKIDYFLYFIPKADYESFIDNAPNGAELISSYQIDKYNCRDVRYGSKGAGLSPEDCVVNLYKLNY